MQTMFFIEGEHEWNQKAIGRAQEEDMWPVRGGKGTFQEEELG